MIDIRIQEGRYAMNAPIDSAKPILVTGATGYVGGRLVPLLLEQGYRVRAVARSLKKLQNRPWATHPNLELATMDIFEPDSVNAALKGCSAAFYLIHCMNPEHADFHDADVKAVEIFTAALSNQGVGRVLYLGGLVDRSKPLSKHLSSRAEMGDRLRQGTVPVTELRAAMIVGSGSASFEILRYLVDRLPVMITPKWVNSKTQPISIRNVLQYLMQCLQVPETAGQIYDIGGPDIFTYRELMDTYARVAGLKIHLVIPVPVFTPTLSSYWIHFITPLHASLARPLAEGLKNDTVCKDTRLRALIPQDLLSCEATIRLALARIKDQAVETHWSDAGFLPDPERVYPGDPAWSGGTVYTDRRQIDMTASPAELWQPIVKIGGATGYYYGNFLWKIRGILDMLFGGVGLRRGRRDPQHLLPGDALDFWRVLEVDAPKRLELMAEMKLPGKAFLSFELVSQDNARTALIQTARFYPQGLLGSLYWYGIMPLHHFVFNGMLRGIANASGKAILKAPRPVLAATTEH
jgi:uncharacterized protein YbjT (DUF2867 family)